MPVDFVAVTSDLMKGDAIITLLRSVYWLQTVKCNKPQLDINKYHK